MTDVAPTTDECGTNRLSSLGERDRDLGERDMSNFTGND
jgi:hypothetical protein